MMLAVAYENSHACHTEIVEFIHSPPSPPLPQVGYVTLFQCKKQETLVLRNLTRCPLLLIVPFFFKRTPVFLTVKLRYSFLKTAAH